MTKLARQKAILEIVQQGPVASQEHLQRALRKRGCEVGQATLSRDLHDLSLVKTPDGYVRMQAGAFAGAPRAFGEYAAVATICRRGCDRKFYGDDSTDRGQRTRGDRGILVGHGGGTKNRVAVLGYAA